MNESCLEKRTADWYIVTSHLLKPLKQCVIDVGSFRLLKSLYSQSILFQHTNNFGSVVPNCGLG